MVGRGLKRDTSVIRDSRAPLTLLPTHPTMQYNDDINNEDEDDDDDHVDDGDDDDGGGN